MLRIRLLVCAVLLGTAHSMAVQAAEIHAGKLGVNFFRGTPLPKWSVPLAQVPATSRRDPVVIRLMETQMWAGPKPAMLISRAIQVNDKSQLAEIGQFSVSYYPAYQKLHLHRIAILRGEQVLERTASANTRLLQREPSIESGFYVGETSVQLLLDDIRVGDTLALTYSIEGRNPVFGTVWADDFSWESLRPIELRRLTISHPAAQPLQWRELGDLKPHAISPVIERLGPIARMRFEAKGMDAIDLEPGLPRAYLPASMIQVSEYSSWTEVAAWANGLFSAPPSTAALAVLAPLVRQFAALKTDEERASAALHWVQDEVRYFSVSMGENSHRPQPPEVVLKRRFGDCKDKARLLIALLGQMGIKAEPVLVNASAPTMPQRLLPSPTWFDHVIVRLHVEGKTYFVDPTREGEKGLLSTLQVGAPGAAGLVVDPASTALINLPDNVLSTPQIDTQEKFIVKTLDGDVQLQVRNTYRGKYAPPFRLRYAAMSTVERNNDILSDYEKQYPGATLSEAAHGADSADGSEFTVDATLSLPKPVTRVDGVVGLAHSTTIMHGSLGVPDKLSRKMPFAPAVGPYRARYRMHISWPGHVKVPAAEEVKIIDNDFFRAHKQYSWRANEVDYQVDYQVKRARLEAAEVPALAREAKLLSAFSESTLQFNEAALVMPEVAALSMRQSDIAHSLLFLQALRTQLADKAQASQVSVAQLCKGILDAYQIGKSIPSMRSTGQLVLREFQSRNIVKEKFACEAEMEFKNGNFAAALTHLAKGDTLNADDVDQLHFAWARLATGNLDGAANDTIRFIQARLKDGSLTPSDAALALLILQRSGKSLPDGLQAYIDALPDGPWPHLVLRFVAGQISQQQLLAATEPMGPTARELALNDAWFYIGARLQGEGKTSAGRDAFRWYPAHGVRGTRSTIFATAELAKIEVQDAEVGKGVAAANARPSNFAAAREHYVRAAARGVVAAENELGYLAEYGKGRTADPREAFERYVRAAQGGDLDGMNNLARMYAAGIGTEKDEVKALAWFRRAAVHGHFYASRNLGRHYRDGTLGLARDPQLAIYHLSTAADLDNADAQQMLSEIYLSGLGVDVNPTLATYWISRAVELDDINAMCQLAFQFTHGRGVPQDAAMALALWRKAAERGSGYAEKELGYVYRYGRGVQKDEAMALEWFQKGAAHGNREAAKQVGMAYQYGWGTAKDGKKARSAFEQLVAEGDHSAYLQLARMAASGVDGPIDPAEADRLYRLCAERGVSDCQFALGSRLHFRKNSDADLVEAAHWYRKAIDQQHYLALSNLADMYEKGVGFAQDIPQAIRMYREAALHGVSEAMFSLGELNETGKGMPVNPYLAVLFYTMALEAGREDVAPALERASRLLDSGQLAKATALAKSWKSLAPLPDEVGGAVAETARPQ